MDDGDIPTTETGGNVMQCAFYYVSISLAGEYSLLLIVMITYLHRLISLSSFKCTLHTTEKWFLLLAALNALGRILYFLLWPHLGYDGVHCEPENIGHRIPPSNAVIKSLAIVPAAFFIAAFSLNVYTFGRVYHQVLRLHTQRQWLIIPIILIVLNISVSGEIWMWAIAKFNEDMMENLGGSISASLVTTSGLLAILFLVYGLLLYTGARVASASTTANAIAATHTHHTPLLHPNTGSTAVSVERIEVRASSQLYDNSNVDSIARTHMETPPSTSNPMKKLLIVSIVCMICFLWRAFSQLFTDLQLKGHASWVNILLYFEISEIIPMALMLYVFEGGRASSTSQVAAGPVAAAAAAARHYNRPHHLQANNIIVGGNMAAAAAVPYGTMLNDGHNGEPGNKAPLLKGNGENKMIANSCSTAATAMDPAEAVVAQYGKELTPMVSQSSILASYTDDARHLDDSNHSLFDHHPHYDHDENATPNMHNNSIA